MGYERDVRGLQKNILIGQALSGGVLLFGLIGLVLFFQPTLFGLSTARADAYQGNVIWLLVGFLFIGLAIAFLVTSGKWQRRLVWVWQNVSPKQMRLKLEVVEDSDSTCYYANLSEDVEVADFSPKWRVHLYSPSWNVSSLEEMETAARVYFDPESKLPAVIEMEPGLLWRMAGSGSAVLQ